MEKNNELLSRFFDGEELFEIGRLIKIEIDSLDHEIPHQQSAGAREAINDRIRRLRNLREDILYLSACLRQSGFDKGIRSSQMFKDKYSFDLNSLDLDNDFGYKGEGSW